jgi:alkanesulfonate monooxygenase SsuD/methylene tetrahydromethanopterin reductase-like flavin-dependent oxidoreductase (luciferase family)
MSLNNSELANDTSGHWSDTFNTLERNSILVLELIEWIDELGFDEAWIGEHHSAGWETIASPEVFIAAAIERTRYIRLGSGVTSLPYHHPLMVANRFVQLDHMSRGRTMLGCGPGALPSDAYMMGIDPSTQRPRMEEALEAIRPYNVERKHILVKVHRTITRYFQPPARPAP